MRSINRQINPRLKIGGVFLTMANETNFRKDIVATAKSNFGKHLLVMDTVIPATVRLAENSTADKSIFQHEPRGAGIGCLPQSDKGGAGDWRQAAQPDF